MNYKPIKTEFRSRGFDYKQIKREGDIAVYSQTRITTGKQNFEVILVARHKGFRVAGQEFPPAETYPTANQWGARGWTQTNLEAAEAKFERVKADRTPVEEEVAELDKEEAGDVEIKEV